MHPKLPTDNENLMAEMIDGSLSLSFPIVASQLELLASLGKRLKEQSTTIEKSIAEFQEAFEQYKDKATKLEDCIKVGEGVISEHLAKLNMKPDHVERSWRLQAMHEDLSKKNEQHHRIFKDNPQITPSTGQDKSDEEIESLHERLDEQAHHQGSDYNHFIDDSVDGKTVAENSPNTGSVLINSYGESNANDGMNKSRQDNPSILELVAEVKSLQKRNEENKQTTLSTKRDDNMEEEIKSLQEGFHEVTDLQASGSDCSTTDSVKENSVTDGSSTADSASSSAQDDLDSALDLQILELAAKVESLQKENELHRSKIQSAKKYTTLSIERDDNKEKDIKSFQEQLQTYHSNHATNDSAEYYVQEKSVTESSPTSESVLNF